MSGLVLPNGDPANVPKDEAPKFEDLTPEQQEALAAKAEATKADPSLHVATAYVVVVDQDGSVAIITDLSTLITPARVANFHDIIGSASVVQATIQAQITASHTQQVMMAQARAMAQQQAHQQEMQQMKGMHLLRS